MTDHTGKLSAPAPLPMLEKRRIEAAILKHVYEVLKASHGKDVAESTVAGAVRKSAVEQAKEMAAAAGGGTSLQTFIDRQALWRAGGALETEVIEQTETTYAYNVTRCRYAEMYREMGLGEIGHLLSCMRDGTFAEGYDRRIALTRTQTIMQGASHCDFRYRLLKDDATD
ncbi:MAG: L-2-amino-thiazoline-4-carboxylic acid hydrolase [Hyphomicrobiaceae bacterium]|nr:L-2-amino-thiazoline-4-carboxylic acid hydrolase [Hyphomicrobiaceae bacterium]